MENPLIDKQDDPRKNLEKTGQDLPEPIRELPKEQQRIAKAVYTAFSIEHRFQGPIPPPEVLAGYDNVLPGSADRILQMAEKQQNHRQTLETSIVQSNIRRESLGLILGFILAVTVLAVSFILILSDKQIAGLVGIIGTTVTLAGVFVYAQREGQRERKEKQQRLQKDQEK